MIHVFGVRHHGPGSARAVVAALGELDPDIVAVELPADSASVLGWAADAEMEPPVAILAHVVDRPERAAFLPFASFSPEWQALRWAAEHHRQVVPIDLPMSVVLADRPPSLDGIDDESVAPRDPLGELAAAAGDDDPERWWEDVVEHRAESSGALGTLAAIAEAITVVRDGWRPSGNEARREAHMRQTLRRLDPAATVAVVCGAWHVPAVEQPWPAAAADSALLRQLPKVKVSMSWVPWSERRLAAGSGYAAGVGSPSWYAHVFNHPGATGRARWFVDAARLLRAAGTDTSPDDLIAATRAAQALAVLRQRPTPGLAEMLDAADTVLATSGGLTLIRDELVVGRRVGSVPAGAPQVPLAADIAAQARRLRLRVTDTERVLELDLRTASGRGRSVFLHRTVAIGVPWGAVIDGRGSSGTFRETWRVRWRPDDAVRLVDVASYGTTLVSAATARLTEHVAAASTPAALIAALEVALFADLERVVGPAVRRLADVATMHTDVAEVIDALGPLARTIRYGDVRGTNRDALMVAFDGLVVRVLAGVHAACRSLDGDAARAMVERLAAAQAALAVLDHPQRRTGWPAALAALANDDVRGDMVHAVVRGRATRLLHDDGQWDGRRVQHSLSRALSVGSDAQHGAAFVEGFLAGSGTVLVHDRDLLGVVDAWLCQLDGDSFQSTVALLRRTFGVFAAAERRQLGELIGDRPSTSVDALGGDLDVERTMAVLVTLGQMTGVPAEVGAALWGGAARR